MLLSVRFNAVSVEWCRHIGATILWDPWDASPQLLRTREPSLLDAQLL
jgi:hypothetical protein